MPLADESFDLIVCQAAFKNFAHPGRALKEMYRVLRTGGGAIIQDMSRDASNAEIGREVSRMRLGRGSALTTRGALKVLRRRAHTTQRLSGPAAARPLRTPYLPTPGIRPGAP